ncbi:helix-turn-helix domain-containing protein [Enterobacter hormaechei]|uniref:helix-turn-helix domain-containing protein n=1 Tax=Enterobacter hormaechei TaxID=158836 RepID=UPI002E2A46A5|nr:helix-turn-helix domain-containing protein [Enterobacter hormaechei]MED5632838.1 helix-turn-helix domain-containing protein [Enterobacter hormaechei]
MVYHNHMHSLLAWIDENIHANLKIDDVATKSGYSKWHLQRVFSFYTGMSLGQYIRIKKIMLAAQDLLCTSETVLDISIKYGYDSQQSFTRTFRRHYSMPPARYRRTMISLK